MDRPRLCDRPGCGAPATAQLTFDYGGRRAWLDDLGEPHPTRFELCQRHADRVGVPLGWGYEDRRGHDERDPAFDIDPAPSYSSPEPVAPHHLGDHDADHDADRFPPALTSRARARAVAS